MGSNNTSHGNRTSIWHVFWRNEGAIVLFMHEETDGVPVMQTRALANTVPTDCLLFIHAVLNCPPPPPPCASPMSHAANAYLDEVLLHTAGRRDDDVHHLVLRLRCRGTDGQPMEAVLGPCNC